MLPRRPRTGLLAYPCLVSDLDLFLSRCTLGDDLRLHVRHVMGAMPHAVIIDLVSDDGFVLLEAEHRTSALMIPAPGKRKPVRAVVLKRRMWRSDTHFVRWVIAHELAHAHLRNAGRHPGEDPEHAADALAAEWGFARPQH